MTETPKPQVCGKCGAVLSGCSPDELCAACLMECAFEAEDQPAAAPAGPAANPQSTIKVTPPEVEGPGAVIGRYKLLEKVGEGGFGVVYVAEQREPVKRRVALKIIKLGMDTRQVVARFEAERQALAMMDHPSIAKVFDAGATDTGRPFFVMELVRGIRITEYCDQNNLSTRERLDLFIKVCQAIQHAHQKGIIHRDIKPSNILVTVNDGVPVPKVIDFGIAKATQGELTDKTVYTQFQQFIGTPAYMSPEQAAMGGLDIDTRSDIYSLGVLLYELLTGSMPFDSKRLIQAGLDEIRRIIREEDPPRPSTKLSTLDVAEQTVIAKRRQSEPPKLQGLIRGDLDWIVMKALEKDRTRRYETSTGLLADIRRHLASELVSARPPSVGYRLHRWARRHKVVFVAGSCVLAALFVGLAVSALLFLRERNAHHRAVAAEMDALAAALESFRLASTMRRMTGGEVDWANELPAFHKVADGWTRERIRRDLQDRPELQAGLLHLLGKNATPFGPTDEDTLSISEKGDFAESPLMLRQSLLREALSLYRRLYGTEHSLVAEVLNDLASDTFVSDKEAEEYARDALAMRRKLLDPHGLEVADSLVQLGTVLSRQTNRAAAEAAYVEALEIRTNHLPPGVFDVACVYLFLAAEQELSGNLAAAEQSFRHALLFRGQNATNIVGFGFRTQFATFLRKRGKLLEAEEQCREALKICKEAHDLTNFVPRALDRLVLVLCEEGKLDEAEVRARESVSLHEQHGSQKWATFRSRGNLGAVLLKQKKYADAEPLLISGYEGLRRNEGEIVGPETILTVAGERVVQLYEEWGKPEQVAKWKLELAKSAKAASSQPTGETKRRQ